MKLVDQTVTLSVTLIQRRQILRRVHWRLTFFALDVTAKSPPDVNPAQAVRLALAWWRASQGHFAL
ncbi:hypothetical protein ACETS7_25820 (plasmid) [Escherichia coli]|uniref:hypothetical protein n=1 Tax=Escherichia coli TaxID=562 RepID=UPI0023E10A56